MIVSTVSKDDNLQVLEDGYAANVEIDFAVPTTPYSSVFKIKDIQINIKKVPSIEADKRNTGIYSSLPPSIN